jgi:hypothetical protein
MTSRCETKPRDARFAHLAAATLERLSSARRIGLLPLTKALTMAGPGRPKWRMLYPVIPECCPLCQWRMAMRYEHLEPLRPVSWKESEAVPAGTMRSSIGGRMAHNAKVFLAGVYAKHLADQLPGKAQQGGSHRRAVPAPHF